MVPIRHGNGVAFVFRAWRAYGSANWWLGIGGGFCCLIRYGNRVAFVFRAWSAYGSASGVGMPRARHPQ
jgi:hypothetical protein